MQAAQSALAVIGRSEPKAIISIIGETDTLNIDNSNYTAQDYENNLRANILAYRAIWPNCLFVIGQTTWRGSGGDTSGSQAVRAAQQQMATDYSWVYISTISSTFHTNGWILNEGGAFVHWDYNALNAAGEDLAIVLDGAL